MALLRPGRCCSRRQGGCLQHRTEAQRRPKGQDAGGTPALPGVAVPAVRWGVSGGRLLIWFQTSPARALPCADHSRVKQRVLMPIRSRGHVPLMRFSASLNIDTQDRQDKQDEKLLHKKLTGSMIECAFVENLSVLRGPSWTPFESFPTPWDPFADSSFCSLNRSFSALGGNLFSLPNLWPIPLELSPTPSWPFVVLRGPSWISFFWPLWITLNCFKQVRPAPCQAIGAAAGPG